MKNVEIKEDLGFDDLVKEARLLKAVIITNDKTINAKLKKENDIRTYTIKDVKGLEFRNAIVVDDKLDVNSKYIAYTRALNNLIIYRNIYYN